MADLIALIAVVILLGGCADTSAYGAYSDTERGICASEGQSATTSLAQHGGYVTRCGLPE
jgi:hypothetical protein